MRSGGCPQCALPLRERIRANAQALAARHGAAIEPIAKAHIRKEDVAAKVRGAWSTATRL
ncbi:MAG TPA: hypothetical protein PLB41_04305 [Rubrivivax sp.]|nr:hypothetical protein [Rubrivivax sp.]HPO18849.1 hypothetical protein [Rubrivivax sp.]